MHIDTTVRAAYDHGFKSISFRDAVQDLELEGSKYKINIVSNFKFIIISITELTL
jgi:dimeric dUTPase (all-alpha-NTP-PPase superfamily)